MHSESAQRILIVDDEPSIREGMKTSLEGMGYVVDTAESGERAIYHLKHNQGISFVVSDFKMPGLNGLDVLKEVKKTSPQTKFVLMTGFGSVNQAVEAIQLGADDYLSKPFSIDTLEKIIHKNSPKLDNVTTASIVTQDANFISLLKKAERASRSVAPILIEGPSGTGKELLARQIHEWSPRASKSWVAINCAALPPGLLESELFGYERGAFTGAMDRKAGKFEQANGGTLLLDEIGELDPLLQAKLLRVLQEGEIDRLGGKKPMKVDVRIIATTNKNLEQMVHDGRFREDLYFRLYGVRFTMPPLRQRRGDIQFIAEEFLKRQSAILGAELSFAPGVLEILSARTWAGNIRELERAVERAAVLSENGKIEIGDFEFEDSRPTHKLPTAPIDPSQKSIKEMEKEIILQALASHSGNRTHTAKALGMSLRTLRHKLKQYRDSGVEVVEFEPNAAGQLPTGKMIQSFPVDSVLLPPVSGEEAGRHLA